MNPPHTLVHPRPFMAQRERVDQELRPGGPLWTYLETRAMSQSSEENPESLIHSWGPYRYLPLDDGHSEGQELSLLSEGKENRDMKEEVNEDESS